MKNIKKYAAVIAIALISGFGVYGVVSAINAQTQQESPKQNVQNEQKESKDNKMESEENEEAEGVESEEADENESEEGEENEADEQAEQAALAKEAKITREQAEAIALKKVPGTILEGELEKEDGKLIYSFDIRKADKQIFDVEVDANTGEIIKAQPDDENGEDEGNETIIRKNFRFEPGENK